MCRKDPVRFDYPDFADVHPLEVENYKMGGYEIVPEENKPNGLIVEFSDQQNEQIKSLITNKKHKK